jgi:hypothetical protein
MLEAFSKDHREDLKEGMECITYHDATKAVIRKRRSRVQELLGSVERGVVVSGTFIMYVWTLDYLPGVQFPGLGNKMM